MQVTTALATSRTTACHAVNLNLGTIGRLEPCDSNPLFGHRPRADISIALAEAHEVLPRPARELDCHVLSTPPSTPLIVLAARHHEVCYYVIGNLAEAGCRAALKRVQRTRRIELGFTTDGVDPLWTSLHFEDLAAQSLEQVLRVRGGRWSNSDDSWRDSLGSLVMSLPQSLATVDAQAARCTIHAAVLVSGDYAKHARRRDRCVAAARQRQRQGA